MTDPAPDWGPFNPVISASEKDARTREMRALAFSLCGPNHPLTVALVAAAAGDELALAEALIEIERLPALRRRKLMTSYAILSRDFTLAKKDR